MSCYLHNIVSAILEPDKNNHCKDEDSNNYWNIVWQKNLVDIINDQEVTGCCWKTFSQKELVYCKDYLPQLDS
jgi:hypothetical protein